MAEGKKSFLLYADIIHTVRHLTDDKAGLLFKHILGYVNDEKPTTDDIIINIAFEPLKQQLKRDLRKWEAYIERQRANGEKGGRPKNPLVNQKTQAFPKKPRKPDTVNVTVTDTVLSSDNVIYSLEDMQRMFENDFELHRMAFQENEFTQAQLKKAKEEFWNIKKTNQDETCAKPYKDIKSHFLNWCRLHKARIKKDNGTTKKHGRVSENDINAFIEGKE